ncbi:MAG: hypothetical protein WEB58_03715 [Planctomycetaceae bacterium]
MKAVEYIIFPEVTPQVFRHLQAAEGFLELGLPDNAAQELIEVPDAGSMEGIRHLLWGRTLKSQEFYPAAIDALLEALKFHPFQFSADLWRTISECYEQTGQETAAKQASEQAEKVSDMKEIVAIFSCSPPRMSEGRQSRTAQADAE